MIGRFTSYTLRHRAIVVVLLLLFVFAGMNAFQRLPVEAFPDVSNMSVQVITLFPGHAAEEVERLVTIPIESQMNSVPKLVSLRSISLFGLSQVTLVFEDGAEPDYVRNQVFQFLSSVALPTGAQASLSPNATPIGEIYRYTLKAPKGYPAVELKALEDWVVERKLRTIPGVVDVVGFGGPTKQYQVQVDPAKLKSYNLSLQQVFTALANGNRNAGGSYVEHGSEMYVVRGLGFVRDPADIGAIAVDSRNGTPIHIRDIGTVTIGNAIRLGRVGMLFKTPNGISDDDDAVQGIVIMRRGENPRDVLEGIHAKVQEINRHYLPPGIRMLPHYDRTELIHRTLHTVRKNMLEGIALVILVLLLFLGLGNYRTALVVALAVPVSLLGAYLILDLRGIPANLISMGAIDFGIIVDSAVVIAENLIRILHERKEKSPSLPGAIIESVREMGRPILFSKAILLTAFIPVFTLQRVEGRIFRPMALTLTYALVTGTIFAVFIVPALLSLVLRRGPHQEDSWIVRRLLQLYRPMLNFALGRRKLIFGAAAFVLLSGGLAYYWIGSEFLPKLDEGALWVRIFMPKSISPSEATKIVDNVRHRLASFPETENVLSQLGRPDDGTDINGFDVCEFNVNLKPRTEWKTAPNREGLVDAMAKKLAEIPGLDSQFSQYIEDNVNEAVSGIKSELAIKLYGEEPEKLQEYADKIADAISTVPGAKDVGTDRFTGQPQIQITVDRGAIARHGVSVSDIQSVIETALGGSAATQVLEGERSFDLVVKLTPKAVSDLDSIRNIPVFGANGERLTLGALTSVEVRSGLAKIMREGNERRIAIKLSVRGRDLGSLVREAEEKAYAAVKLPPGYHMVWTGAFENEQRAVRRLAVVVPITIVAIFFLLFTAFDSGKFASLILLNVPFAAVGGLLALLLVGLDLSVSAMVGFIALFGVSIQSGVLLVERIRDLRRLGRPVRDAVIEGSVSRVRPVMMTSLMAALGLLPAAISTGVGAETARPFAVVIIGGLVTATLLTLLLLPVLYPTFESEKTQ
ncbi:MAG TPA: CusA/CzcA family heavy metal efflux RND transporter [Candidatus Binatia bacterium]|jgi:cobalt-zinc-cadmium resistance protein CzcA|nr:CusA/CzcA family heavy metal efflux RND transporter [Candidatus Binatia bacterium]